jgi:hypothetical protein
MLEDGNPLSVRKSGGALRGISVGVDATRNWTSPHPQKMMEFNEVGIPEKRKAGPRELVYSKMTPVWIWQGWREAVSFFQRRIRWRYGSLLLDKYEK